MMPARPVSVIAGAAALRQAMLFLRQQQPHPYAWAPFIALGRDAPLSPLASIPRYPPPVTSELMGVFLPMLKDR